MIRRLILSLSALLATAGGAFSSSPVLGSNPEAGQRLGIELEDGEVETLIVSVRAHGVEPTLMIGLHGYGMEASQIATLVDLEPSFDHIYLAPEGFHRLADGSKGWFPIGWDGEKVEIDQRELAAFSDRFESYVHAVAERFSAGRLVIIGYSQGGAAAIHLATTKPDLADAFVALAGSALGAMPVKSSLPARLFIGHGTLDALVDTESMRAEASNLEQAGLDVTYREYAVPHVVSAAHRRDVTAWLERWRR